MAFVRPFYSSIFELASVWVTKEHEPAYVRFLDGLFGAITEAINGHEMDLDTRQLEVLGAQPIGATRWVQRVAEQHQTCGGSEGKLLRSRDNHMDY